MATLTQDVFLALLIVGGSVGVAFYGYSSHRIGARHGKWSAPYGAVYAALLVSTLFGGAAAEFDRPSAVLMSLVSWVLYSHLVLRRVIVKGNWPLRAAAVFLGFLALVLFPLFTLFSAGPDLFALMYRAAAFGGWVIGIALGQSPEKK